MTHSDVPGAEADASPFERGPPGGLPQGFVARGPGRNAAVRGAVAVLLLGWIPLVVLSTVAGQKGALASLLGDAGADARFAIAAPLFVLALAACGRRLGHVAEHFLSTGVIPPADRQRFLEVMARARRRVRSRWAELAVWLLAYALAAAMYVAARAPPASAGWLLAADGRSLSAAGCWHWIVSIPLLLALMAGWIWRAVVWARCLREISRLDLQLIAAHPDGAAGLGFLAESVRAFSAVSLAFGVLAASRFASVHLAGVDTPMTTSFLVALTVAVALAFGVAPLTVFTPLLMRTWRQGVVTYGGLANRLGAQFERKWLATSDERDMLGEPDFSATTDLYQVAGNVYALRLLPVDRQSLAILLVPALLPFIPAMFVSMPLSEVLQELRGLVS